MKFALGAIAALTLLETTWAQVAVYGQCGGENYSGSTDCASGATCTEVNDYYSQCMPGGAVASTGGSTTSGSTGSTTSDGSSTGNTDAAAGNPYTGATVWKSTYYAAEVTAAAALVSDSSLSAKILEVAQVPTFTWFDTTAKVADLPGYLTAAAGQILQIVVYNLPNRDCHANASNGELHYDNNGAALYQQYIDGISAAVKAASGATVVAVIEPDSLANLVTNLSDSRCSSVETEYEASVTYAITSLSAVGVYQYLDAGHAGWLGWPANISPAATLFIKMWTAGGKSSYIRGLATNVANYNALVAASADPITQGDSNYDESLYINALAPMLSSGGWNARFIVDQGRSGVQGIRTAWGNWCNIKGAGFGLRPTSSVSQNSYVDAIVWVKPGGECDGTSNSSSPRYDPMCSGTDAKVPAPEAGTWFQAYFLDLVNNANPAF